MATTTLVTTEVDARAAEVERQVAEARAQAEAIQVRDQAEADVAAEYLREIRRRQKAAEAERVELTKPLLDTKKKIDKRIKDAVAPYDEAFDVVQGRLGTYTAEQERIRQEEEARLEAERQERERKAREARERQEAEERAKRDQAEAEYEEAAQLAREAADGEDREAAESLATEAAEKVDDAFVAEQAIASLPEVSLPKAVVPSAPRQDGISGRTKREATITDRAALPEFLPDGTPLIVVDMVALRRWMNERWTETGEPPELPGAKFERVADGMAVRG
jgi:hypothetical protein